MNFAVRMWILVALATNKGNTAGNTVALTTSGGQTSWLYSGDGWAFWDGDNVNPVYQINAQIPCGYPTGSLQLAVWNPHDAAQPTNCQINVVAGGGC